VKSNAWKQKAERMLIPVMLQRWHEIAFFHWSCEPALLQRLLPSGLELDRFDGKAWISLTPFLLTGLRPPLFPRGVSVDFPEMNLRTYVVGPQGPGIWFFSLDAARLFAVVGARATYGLPYFSASMAVSKGPAENLYWSRRASGAKATIRIAKEGRIAQQSPLDVFLTARLRLYSVYAGRLITAQVSHPPWELNRVRILDFEETVRRSMGVEFPSDQFLAHHSPGIDSKIGFPHRSGVR
jgi:uncharacterized protein YqjF (DUF2071 family)